MTYYSPNDLSANFRETILMIEDNRLAGNLQKAIEYFSHDEIRIEFVASLRWENGENNLFNRLNVLARR